MKLQKLTAVAVPFVRQTIVLAFVAPSTRYHEIIGAIRSTAIKRYNVIDVVGVVNNLIAPITFTTLTLVLVLDVFFGMDTLRGLLLSVTVAPVDALSIASALTLSVALGCLSAFGWVPFTSFSEVFRFRTGPILAFGTLLRATFVPFALIGTYPYLIGGIVSALISALAVFALRTMTIFALRGAVKISQWLGDTAVGAWFHSVSLSLYHMMLSANGVISRLFGLQSLADFYSIPHNCEVKP